MFFQKNIISGFLVVIVVAPMTPSVGAPTSPLQVSDVVSMTSFPWGAPTTAISPDGSRVAYVSETNPDDSHWVAGDWTNWGRRELWIQGFSGGMPLRVEMPQG